MAVRLLTFCCASPNPTVCRRTACSAYSSRELCTVPVRTPPDDPTARSSGMASSGRVCLAKPGVEAFATLFCVTANTCSYALRALDELSREARRFAMPLPHQTDQSPASRRRRYTPWCVAGSHGCPGMAPLLKVVSRDL